MRVEDDDYVRPDAPFWGRIIIVLAVIAAVPVMLWSISTFLRVYVATPKAPTYRAQASKPATEPAPAVTAQASVQAVPATQQAAAAPATPIVAASATGSDGRGPRLDATAPRLGERTLDGTGSAPAAPKVALPKVADAGPMTARPPVAPMAPALPPQQVAAAAPQGQGASAISVPNSAPDLGPITTAAITSPKSTDWPAPAAEALPAAKPITGRIPLPRRRPPGIAVAAPPPPAATPAAPSPEPATMAAADTLPAAAPISGPIPLPPRRPRDLAMAQGAAPLPRVRPQAAPEAVPSTTDEVPFSRDLTAH